MPRPVRAAGSFLRRNLRLPKRWPDAVLQVVIWVCVDSIYELVRGLTEGSHTVAFANGNRVVELERATHTFFEVDFQRSILDDRWLIDVTNFLYMNLHFALTTVFLAWLYLRRNEVFYFVRNVFIGTMAIAIAIHAVFPTAPPRLLTQYGFVDTIFSIGGVDQDQGAISALVNKYAAVPSVHVGFALILGVTAAMLARRRWAKIVWACYPLLMLYIVVATANHFWLDGLAGVAAAGLAVLLAKYPLTRLRPNHWAWRIPRREPTAAPASAPAPAAARP
jgi:membrane-associated phospholipid phosphatase